MNRSNIEAIQSATLRMLNAQIAHVLAVMLIKGWKFPNKYDLGVTVLASTALASTVKVRMDNVSFETMVTSTGTADDIIKISDDIVGAWLAKHATERPTQKRRSDG